MEKKIRVKVVGDDHFIGFIHNKRVKPGEELVISEKAFSKKWMEKLDEPEFQADEVSEVGEKKPKASKRKPTKSDDDVI